MLKILSADVKRQIFWVNYTSDEAKILWNELFAIIHDKHPSDIEFDVVFLLFSLKHVERCSLWNKDDGLELKSSFHWELLNCKMVLPVISKTLVEASIIFFRDFFWFLHPNRFVFVELFQLSRDFFYFLLLFIFLLFCNLHITLFLFLFLLVVWNLFLSSLLNLKWYRESNELRMFFHQIFKLSLF